MRSPREDHEQRRPTAALVVPNMPAPTWGRAMGDSLRRQAYGCGTIWYGVV
jgi:hypothetical protein